MRPFHLGKAVTDVSLDHQPTRAQVIISGPMVPDSSTLCNRVIPSTFSDGESTTFLARNGGCHLCPPEPPELLEFQPPAWIPPRRWKWTRWCRRRYKVLTDSEVSFLPSSSRLSPRPSSHHVRKSSSQWRRRESARPRVALFCRSVTKRPHLTQRRFQGSNVHRRDMRIAAKPTVLPLS